MRVACCVLRDACCVLRVSGCVLRDACCVMRVACCVLRDAYCVMRVARCVSHDACCAMLVAMRDAFCGVFAFLFEKKRDRGKSRKWEDAGATCRSVRRDGKKKNKRGEERGQ